MRKRTKYFTLMAATLLVAFSFFDYFINPKGGIFCPDFNSNKTFQFEGRACLSSGGTFATSAKYMGRENMILIKFGHPLFRMCRWVSTPRYTIETTSQALSNKTVDRGTYSCRKNLIVTIK